MKVRKISLTLQIIIINLAILLTTTIVLGVVTTLMSENTMVALVKQRMLDIANAAAASIDGDELEGIRNGDQGTESYEKVLAALNIFREHTDLEYIYCLQQTGSESFIFTIDSDPEDPADWGDDVETTDALISAGNGTTDVDDQPSSDEWGSHYSSYSPVFNSSGRVVGIVGVDFSADWYDSQVSEHIRMVFILSGILLVVSVAAILLLTARIRKSFGTLNDKLSDIADGSGDLTKKIEISSGDEFEVISDNMNTFIDQIRDIVSGVKNNVSDSISASNELSVISDHAADTMDSLSRAIAGVSDGALRQTEDVETASDNVRTIVDRLSEMTQTVNTAEEYTGSMTENSTLVAESFDDLIRSIQESMTELEQVTKEMSSVGSYVEEVTNAANAINSIANRTNLLSLNASIEAARAGEAGRGFAVVADEIGKLAIQSNESSASIRSIMTELKAQTDKTIDLITRLNSVMSHQEKTSIDSKESLGALLENIDNTRQNFETIRIDVSRINEACDQLNGTIDSLSSISSENANSAEITSGACDDISRIIYSVSDKAGIIKAHSDELGNAVGKYKV